MARARDGVEIAFETFGRADAPAVVLVHGWAGNRTYWRNQIEFLARDHHVVAVDLGGHGESGVGRTDWTLPAFGDDVVAVVDEIGVDNVALVGHSMGGDAITFAALKLGDRIRGMVWVDVFRSLAVEPETPPEGIEGFVAPFFDDFESTVDGFARSLFPPSADAELVDRVAADMVATPKEAALGSIRYAPNRVLPILAALTEISAPVVAINPDMGETDVESMRANGVEPIILKRVGHFAMLEDPEQFNPVLAATLASF